MWIRQVIAIASLVPVAAAPSGLSTPQLGFVRAPDATLRPLWGVRANFLLGPPVAEGVIGAVSGGGQSLAHRPGELILFDGGGSTGILPVPSGPAVLGLDLRGLPAVAWFPDAAALALRQRGRWRIAPFEPGGLALAVALRGPGVVLFVLRRPDGVWRIQTSIDDGATLDAVRLAGAVNAAVFLPENLILYHGADELVLLDGTGTERRTPLPGMVTAMEPAGEGWVLLHRQEPCPPLLVQTKVDPLSVFLLPGGAR